MRIFFTTRHLMALVSKHCKLLQLDATYKLLWLGFPVLIAGFTDMDKVFHPIGLALCRDEKAEDFDFVCRGILHGIERCGYPMLENVNLMADAADAITNGFQSCFYPLENAQFKRGMF